MDDVVAGLRAVEEDALARLAAAGVASEIEALEREVLGNASAVAEARRSLRGLSDEERREAGRAINEIAGRLAERIGIRRAEVTAAEEAARLEQEHLDITMPGRAPARGAAHLVMQVLEEVTDIFVALGYTVADGPEAETAYYHFDALNTPPSHPARLESDTLYVEHGRDPEGVLLRAQTSPVQVRYMEQHPPPVYVVSPGRVFRRDTMDATHTPVFHQIEGLAVDTDVTFADLKGTLAHFARQFFGPAQKVRFVPHFFPFTEPSAEMHTSCFACGGSGCRVCGGSGWIELLGCGVVDPNVFESVGYDPTAVSGFAFGVGLDRLAQIRHGVPELRYFFDPDLRVLEQFR
jgi:phenylalanyl-tRNA synthetase alpha chain